MPDSSAIVRTRFAPSPSGHLHVGGARTALFCWAYARARGGRFMLRIEDTDQKRSSDAASVGFLEDLMWLGIDWDEGPVYEAPDGRRAGGGEHGPYFQSQRLDIYDREIDRLIREGRAYRAFETPQELDAARARAAAEKRPYRYDRASLRLDRATIERYLNEGRPHVVRFRVPDEGSVVVRDQVRGDVVTDLRELDDFVIRKQDGFPMYNFAVVVDDELMGVTHVIRAQEHLSNTPRHMLLQQALGYRTPVYAHISIITNPDGSKMSKRDKDKALRAAVKQRQLSAPPAGAVAPSRWAWWLESGDHQLDLEEAERLAAALAIDLPEINVDDFRRRGYLPEVMINYLALLGWNPGENIEKFDVAFLIEKFDFDRVIKSPAKFDRAKLLAFNVDAIAALPADEFASRLRRHGERYHPWFIAALGPERFALFARANQARSKTLDDPFRDGRFFVLPDDAIQIEDSKPVRKALGGGSGGEGGDGSRGGFDHLEALQPVLRALEPWTIQSIEHAVKQYADAHADGQLGKVAQPLRVAVSGGTVSPAIFETLAILGKDATLRRIERCLSWRGSFAAT